MQAILLQSSFCLTQEAGLLILFLPLQNTEKVIPIMIIITIIIIILNIIVLIITVILCSTLSK